MQPRHTMDIAEWRIPSLCSGKTITLFSCVVRLMLRKNRKRLNAFIRRCTRLDYCNQNLTTVSEQFDEADETIF